MKSNNTAVFNKSSEVYLPSTTSLLLQNINSAEVGDESNKNSFGL